MLTLSQLTLTLLPHSPIQSQENLDSYLILVIDGQHHYTPTTKADTNKFSWSLQAEDIKIYTINSAYI